MQAHASAQVQYRDFAFGVTQGVLTPTADGQLLSARAQLPPYPNSMAEPFLHWAATQPNRTWLARRDASGAWQRLSYGDALAKGRAIGQFILNLGLSTDRPVLIASENSLEHALIGLAAMLVGVPQVPTSPAYSLMSQDFSKLRHVMDTVTPGLVYASDARYAKALSATVTPGCTVVVNDTTGFDASLQALAFAQVLSTTATTAVDEATASLGPDSIVKFLFTSGSTKLPKAVINTHRMWCANQQQMAQSMPAIAEQPPVLVDWLPWNHTFGGNHNFGMVMFHGCTLYINDGKPVPALVAETIRNLREISPTMYFDVPVGFELLANAMQTDEALRNSLFAQCRMCFYAGAALAQPVWDRLFAAQEQAIGKRIVMGTGLGMTESSPVGIFVASSKVKAGDLGLPTPGLQLKLVPMGGKTEVRYKGPNITPGYWRNPQATSDAFDAEGFFCTGDAVAWIDPDDPHQGLRFDGRVAEDFKLSTGTFVSVGPLRAKIVAACAPYVQDAVITGLNRREVGALLVPTPRIRQLCDLPADTPLEQVLQNAAVQAHFQTVVDALASGATGSASRVAFAHLMHEPPSIDKGEITDKGSINQAAVLKHRDALVEGLHTGSLAHTIRPTPR